MNKVNIKWNEYIENCYELSNMIKEKGLSHIPILSILRGGCIPGILVSHHLGNRDIQVIGVHTYEKYVRMEKEIITQKPNCIYNRVLIIDDLVDSGETLDIVKSYLNNQKRGRVDIYTAVVYSKHPTYHVDFKVKDIDPNAWVVFPYENING